MNQLLCVEIHCDRNIRWKPLPITIRERWMYEWIPHINSPTALYWDPVFLDKIYQVKTSPNHNYRETNVWVNSTYKQFDYLEFKKETSVMRKFKMKIRVLGWTNQVLVWSDIIYLVFLFLAFCFYFYYFRVVKMYLHFSNFMKILP